MKKLLIVLVIVTLVMSMGMVTALAAESSPDPDATETPDPTATPDTRSPLQKAVTEDVAGSVLDEVMGVFPVLLAALVGFIGIRKGLGFVLGLLRSS